jgi:NAD(P)H-nitrite reductase large subunit
MLLRELRRAGHVPSLVAALLHFDGDLLATGEPTDHLVCSCQVVARSDIVAAICTHRLTTVEGVSERTGAATGCGGCRPDVEALLGA